MSLENWSLRPLVRRFPLRWERRSSHRKCSPSVVSADSFETRVDLPRVVSSWVTQRTYRKTHGVNPANFPLTHTYCPTCLTKVQKTMRQYFRKIGTAA